MSDTDAIIGRSQAAAWEHVEQSLRYCLDDDEAADLALMLKEEPESVMQLLYDWWPHRHDDPVGLLIDGEFIPQALVAKHLPFAAPPEATVQAVYALGGGQRLSHDRS